MLDLELKRANIASIGDICDVSARVRMQQKFLRLNGSANEGARELAARHVSA